MKTSSFQGWPSMLRRANQSNRGSRAGRRRHTLHLEALEERITLSLSPQMVLDINANTLSSSPSAIGAIGSTAYFTADDGLHGVEVWKSDGTAAGTGLLKDINPGSASSGPRNLTNVNGTLFFVAGEGVNGIELWKSDGTAAGTALVKDIVAGSVSASPSDLTNVNGTLFLATGDGTALWKSDGTAAGTVLVSSSAMYPHNLTDVNGALLFS